MNRITPDDIQRLPSKKHIFVYGSNLAGIHGKGAALTATKKFAATRGRCHGLDNNSYGIPTKDTRFKQLPIDKIKRYVDNFVLDAKTWNSEDDKLYFLVTEIGCGLAGHSPEDIAPLFRDCLELENVWLPERFINILNNLK